MADIQKLDILRKLREECGLSLATMAKAIGFTGVSARQRMGFWESGSQIPSPKHRVAFLRYLKSYLKLQNDPDRLQQVWTVLVSEWHWLPLRDQELLGYVPSPENKGQSASAATVQVALPKRTKPFIPRKDKYGQRLDLLVTSALESDSIVLLWGSGGVGKSRLALEVAYEVLTATRRVFWIPVELYPTFDITLMLDELLLQLHREDALQFELAHKIALVRSLFKSSDLIILDGLEVAADEQAIYLFMRQMPSATLVTSRSFNSEAFTISIGPMFPFESESLTTALLQQSTPANEQGPVDIHTLTESVAHNPMAIRWVVGQLQSGITLNAATGDLGSSPDQLVTRVFERSLHKLDNAAQDVLLFLALCAGGVFAYQLSDALQMLDPTQIEGHIAALRNLKLIEGDLDEPLQLSGLTLVLARVQFQRSPNYSTLAARFVDYFSREAAKTAAGDDGYDTDQFQKQRANFVRAFELAQEHNRPDRVLHLWDNISTRLWSQGFWDDHAHCGKITLQAALQLSNQVVYATTLTDLAWVLIDRVQYTQAISLIEQALSIYSQLHHVDGEVTCLTYLGICALRSRQFDSAEAYLRSGLAIAEQHNLLSKCASLHNSLGSLFCEQNKHDLALNTYRLSMSIFEQLNESARLLIVMRNIGALELDRGNMAGAKSLFEDARTTAAKLGRRDLVAGLNQMLARVAEKSGDLMLAVDLATLSMQEFRNLKMGHDAHLAEELIDRVIKRNTV